MDKDSDNSRLAFGTDDTEATTNKGSRTPTTPDGALVYDYIDEELGPNLERNSLLLLSNTTAGAEDYEDPSVPAFFGMNMKTRWRKGNRNTHDKEILIGVSIWLVLILTTISFMGMAAPVAFVLVLLLIWVGTRYFPLVMALAAVLSLFSSVPHLIIPAPAILVACHFAVTTLVKKWRSLRRNMEEEPPLPEYWHRLDKGFTIAFKVLVVLVAVGYAIFLIWMIMTDEFEWLDYLWFLFQSTTALVSIGYTLIMTLIVRDRSSLRYLLNPRRELQENESRRAIRYARQFILNPNDPLGEPLLVV